MNISGFQPYALYFLSQRRKDAKKKFYYIFDNKQL